MEFVWIFKGNGANPFPSAVFSNLEKAEAWIKKHKLTGTLTKYPIDISVFDWAIKKEYFSPNEHHFQPKVIGNFSSASQEHFHYEDGV